MSGCRQEMCPTWDGHGCPCEAFGLDRDDLPTDGVFTIDGPCLPSLGEPCGDCHRCTEPQDAP